MKNNLDTTVLTREHKVYAGSEHQRIVAEVQQLMAQCDALEASLKAAATVSERWSAAAVRRMLDGTARPAPAR